MDEKEYHVELFPGKDSTIVLENDKRPNLTIWKRDADSGAPVEGAVFLVKTADGHSVAEVTTGPDGSAKVPNLLPMVYEVIEKSVPSPYLPDAPSQLVTLYPNRDREVYFENHKKPSVTIQKENSVTHDPIESAEFHITWSSNKTETGEQRDLGTFQTDEAGQIILEAIEDGWLKIEETKPAPGFQAPDNPVTEVYVKGGENKTITISNIPLSALVVYKQDSVTGAGISGCRFQLKYLGGEVSGSGGTVIGTYTTSANGSFTVTGLKKGYYICEELESDSSHVIDAAPQSFYISGEDQDIVTLYFSNAPKGAILVKKVSSADNSPLSDVEFLVTKSDGSVVGDANGKFVTDSTGTFLVKGVEPGTTLIIKETRAKPGYLLDDTPQTVQVKEGQTVTVEFRNQPMGNLIIHKLSSKDKTPLEGVQFKITYADGTYLPDEGGKLSSNGLYWTNAEGQIVLSGITGTVVVTEVESIPGYTIDPNTQSQTVVVNPDDTQELWFYNSPVGGVEFTKVNEADKTETISGVTFEIRRVSDDALVDTVTTGKDGKVFLPLEAGDYYAQETKAADGFKLDDTPIYFTVKDGETTRKTVTNKAFSGILLHKIDADTRKGIYGATFLLYDGNMNPVDQFTTDQNGYAYIDTLELSGKVYLRELENEGYIVDEQLKTVYIKPGETTEITWENRAITGQIQIVKKSADYNPTNGLPAGTLLEGAVFEIYDKAGNLVDTIRSDSRGLAVSKPLPLSRYTIREVKAPANYGVNETELTAYLEHEGQIVKFEVTNKSLTTGVSITKTGPKEIMAGQPVRYTFSGIANTSNVRLDSFYWRDTLPAEVRLDIPVRLASVVLSCQHDPEKDLDQLQAELMDHVIQPALRELPPDADTEILINPSGRFVYGGFEADTGLTGRKLMVDTYGGLAPHGGGALSGKDATKVDRSGAYMARYIAKNIVSAGLADRCTVTLAYAIGKAEPVAANVDTDGTGEYRDEVLEQAVRAVFDLTPAGMRHTLGLDKPIFAQFCNYGHFTHPDAPWEQTEKAEVLCNACRIKEAGVSDR